MKGVLKMSKKNAIQTITFVGHFRIYFKNGEPAYLVDANGKKHRFYKAKKNRSKAFINKEEKYEYI